MEVNRSHEHQRNPLVNEYLSSFGLSQRDLFLAQPAELLQRIPAYPSIRVDFRHLADSLHVLGWTKRGAERAMLFIQALKFYSMGSAPLSIVRVGQEVVDEFLELGDPAGARGTIEQHILPVVDEMGFVDEVVDVRAQYAVVLAYTGAIDEARRLIGTLRSYHVSEAMADQLRDQAGIIERLARDLSIVEERRRLIGTRKIGRNEPCPRESGKKVQALPRARFTVTGRQRRAMIAALSNDAHRRASAEATRENDCLRYNISSRLGRASLDWP